MEAIIEKRLQVLQEPPGDCVLIVQAGYHHHPLTVLVLIHFAADPAEQLLLALLAGLDATTGGVIRHSDQLRYRCPHGRPSR